MISPDCSILNLPSVNNSLSSRRPKSPELRNFLEILLRDHFTLHHYKRRNPLYYEGHPAVGVYCVRSGRAKVYRMGSNGKPHILQIANSEDFLGVECILGGEEYMSSCEMLEDGQVAFLDRQKFLELIRQNVGLAYEMSRYLARRVLSGDEARVHLADARVRERMARALLLLARSYGVSVKDGVRLDIRLKREDLANLVGTAVGTVLRLLKDLREEGLLLAPQGKKIILLNLEKLEEVARLG